MSKINILPSEVFNLIAAGEVVERPASIIKELVENSIDAGATEIQISIEEGGIKKIRVVDNGTGIEPSEMDKVLLPHATSKIRTADDLSKIGTLGFRGEALASISAVSKIKITSKTKNQELGVVLSHDNTGIIKNQTGATDGTVVEVCDLFYCIPARAKFLKKPKTEETEITTLVSRYILANPNIAFKYVADGKTIYQSTGAGRKEALFAIYGKDAVDNTIEINRKFGDIVVSGFIGKPTYSKSNRTYQTLVLNGRYIQNLAVQTAVTTGYGDFLMKRQYPFYVLFIDMPLEDVDVNVHPNKLEVRFSANINLYPIVFETVVRALHQNDYNPEVLSERTEIVRPIQTVEPKRGDGTVYVSESKPLTKIDNYFDAANHLFGDKMVANAPAADLGFLKKEGNSVVNIQTGEVVADSTRKTQVVTENKQLTFNLAPEYKVVGKLFNTYLVIEQGSDVLFIDQHAMHERILFERLKDQIDNDNVAVQPMLFPHIFATNAAETVFLNDHKADFAALGFELEQFGENSFKISALPAVCADMSITTFITAVLSNIKDLSVEKTSDLIRDKLATRACKAAVKGGWDLTKEEIEKLLLDMQTENTPLRCPHGRPSVVKVSKSDIEKWFKRIV